MKSRVIAAEVPGGLDIDTVFTQLQTNKEWKRQDEKFEMYFAAATRTLTALNNANLKAEDSAAEATKLIDESVDVLALVLDERYKSSPDPQPLQLSTPARTLATYWEHRFFDDMRRLRVRDPDTLTRVTEYMPEIIAFIGKIIQNGYGYEYEGSVYFDTKAFDESPGHVYAKLEPWSRGNLRESTDGEGQYAAQ